MRKELDDALCRDFPELYADRHADMRTTCMCWGFSCGDGWEPLIRKLSEQLTWLAEHEGVPIKATQVKEKYGTLRFYTSGETDIMDACISHAEAKSAQTCEVCGKYGRTRNGGWITTLCAQHAYEQQYPLSAWEAEDLGVPDHVEEPTDES